MCITLTCIENMSVQHQKCDVHIIVNDKTALLVLGGIGSPFAEVVMTALLADESVIHCFDLSKHKLLRWTITIKVDRGVAHSCDCSKHSIGIGSELVVLHEESSTND